MHRIATKLFSTQLCTMYTQSAITILSLRGANHTQRIPKFYFDKPAARSLHVIIQVESVEFFHCWLHNMIISLLRNKVKQEKKITSMTLRLDTTTFLHTEHNTERCRVSCTFNIHSSEIDTISQQSTNASETTAKLRSFL